MIANENLKLKRTLIECTLIEDQQSKFSGIINSVKKWLKDIKDRLKNIIKDLYDKVIDKFKKAKVNENISEKAVEPEKIRNFGGFMDAIDVKYKETVKDVENIINTESLDKEDPKLKKASASIEKFTSTINDGMAKVLSKIGLSKDKNIQEGISSNSGSILRERKRVFKIFTRFTVGVIKDIKKMISLLTGRIKKCENDLSVQEKSSNENNGSENTSFSKKFSMHNNIIGKTIKFVGTMIKTVVRIFVITFRLGVTSFS